MGQTQSTSEYKTCSGLGNDGAALLKCWDPPCEVESARETSTGIGSASSFSPRVDPVRNPRGGAESTAGLGPAPAPPSEADSAPESSAGSDSVCGSPQAECSFSKAALDVELLDLCSHSKSVSEAESNDFFTVSSTETIWCSVSCGGTESEDDLGSACGAAPAGCPTFCIHSPNSPSVPEGDDKLWDLSWGGFRHHILGDEESTDCSSDEDEIGFGDEENQDGDDDGVQVLGGPKWLMTGHMRWVRM